MAKIIESPRPDGSVWSDNLHMFVRHDDRKGTPFKCGNCDAPKLCEKYEACRVSVRGTTTP